jgi:hypothetical protein
VAVVGLAITLGAGTADTYRAGEVVCRFALLVAAVTFGISSLVQGGRRAWPAVAVAAVVVLAVASHFGWFARGLTAADRAPLLVDGDRLRHPTLGFSIANPGSAFHEAPAAAAQMRDSLKLPDAPVYAYAGPGTPPSALLLVVVKPLESSVPQELDGVEAGMLASATTKNLSPTLIDHHATDDQANAHMKFGDVHTRVQIYLRHPPDREPMTVTLMVISRDEHALDDVLGSLR